MFRGMKPHTHTHKHTPKCQFTYLYIYACYVLVNSFNLIISLAVLSGWDVARFTSFFSFFFHNHVSFIVKIWHVCFPLFLYFFVNRQFVCLCVCVCICFTLCMHFDIFPLLHLNIKHNQYKASPKRKRHTWFQNVSLSFYINLSVSLACFFLFLFLKNFSCIPFEPLKNYCNPGHLHVYNGVGTNLHSV